MAFGGVLLSRHTPHRTCTGCRAVVPQHDLVRVGVDGTRIVLDPPRRLPGRGAYVHPRTECVTTPGLARALKRAVTRDDVERIVTSIAGMSRGGDNSPGDGEGGDDLGKNAPGLAGAKPVETPPRIKAQGSQRRAAPLWPDKDDRSADASV